MMERITLTLVAFVFATGLVAQGKQISLGVDIAIPLREFDNRLSLGRGPAVGFELPAGEKLGVTLQGAYDFLVTNDSISQIVKSSIMIPFQGGLKYYFKGQQEGFYAHAQLGIHFSMRKYYDEVYNSNSIDPTWAIGVGYQLEHFDFGVRYNSLLSWKNHGGGGVGYLGLRLAYLIKLN